MTFWPRELFKKFFFQRRSFQKRVSKAFSNFYSSIDSCQTFASFCSEVHGREVPQFNLVNKEQWETFLCEADKICFDEGDYLLDLGCGLGYLTEEISARYNIQGVGMDFSTTAVELANRRSSLIFEEKDVQNLKDQFCDRQFKLITSFDGLYGSNWKQTLKALLSVLSPGGKIMIFQSTVLKNRDDKIPLLESSDMVTAKVWDFTESERAFYEHSKVVLEKMKSQFEKEGSHKAFSIKEKECDKGLFWHQRGLAKRNFVTFERKIIG